MLGLPQTVPAEGARAREWDAHGKVLDVARKHLSGQPGQERGTASLCTKSRASAISQAAMAGPTSAQPP